MTTNYSHIIKKALDYIPASIPVFESSRLKDLYDLKILDTEQEERFDRYTKFATDIFNTPVSLISLVDANRQWFKSACGVSAEDTSNDMSSRNISFCAHAILEDRLLVIPDMLADDQFIFHPLVQNAPFVRFYAGAIIRGPEDYPIGTLCLIDFKAREFNTTHQNQLLQLAKLVEQEVHSHYTLTQVYGNLRKAVFYHPITDLPNRRLFQERLEEAIQQNDADSEIIVLSLNIMRFHDIKNVFGQIFAHKILKEVCLRLREIKKIDLNICNDEHDNFFFFIEAPRNFSETQDFQIIINDLLAIFKRSFLQKDVFNNNGERNLNVLTCAIGGSVFPKDGSKANELIEKTSLARDSTSSSNSSFQFYAHHLSQGLTEYFNLEKKLREAIEENLLTLNYQPIVDCQSERIMVVEDLCRWYDKEKGPISPIEFIPVAEESGLIIDLGKWVMEQACKDAQEWQEKGLHPLSVSVNVTKELLLSRDFKKTISDILIKTGLKPHLLKLEITESAFIQDLNEAIKIMKDILNLGVSFVVDDFGTGYSSLSYLRELPVCTLKIDKSFIDPITHNTKSASLTHNIIIIGKSLGLEVVAEGVETKEQLMFLRAYQCSLIQGYWFSKPLPKNDLEKLWLFP